MAPLNLVVLRASDITIFASIAADLSLRWTSWQNSWDVQFDALSERLLNFIGQLWGEVCCFLFILQHNNSPYFSASNITSFATTVAALPLAWILPWNSWNVYSETLFGHLLNVTDQLWWEVCFTLSVVQHDIFLHTSDWHCHCFDSLATSPCVSSWQAQKLVSTWFDI